MTQSYFLGANTKAGFSSLYEAFPPDPADFLHIIKGGPGTGKSGYMRKIAEAAEENGLEVHRVLCSGDPDSLDGVYLPERHLAWVDGTAPHAQEPRLFGADADYLNLGCFFHGPFSPEEKEHVSSLNYSYKEKYQEAYRLLSDVHVKQGTIGGSNPSDQILKLPVREGNCGHLSRRWIRAITCKGLLESELSLYDRISAPAELLEAAAVQATQRGYDAILCPSPLDKGTPEALLLPKAGLLFEAWAELEPESVPALQQAIEKLREAKALHDRLEAVYKPHMDFVSLSAFTQITLRELFG